MAAVIMPLEATFGNVPTLHLAIVVSVGACVYASSMFLLWSVTGRPDGIESHIAKILVSRVQKIRKMH